MTPLQVIVASLNGYFRDLNNKNGIYSEGMLRGEQFQGGGTPLSL